MEVAPKDRPLVEALGDDEDELRVRVRRRAHHVVEHVVLALGHRARVDPLDPQQREAEHVRVVRGAGFRVTGDQRIMVEAEEAQRQRGRRRRRAREEMLA